MKVHGETCSRCTGVWYTVLNVRHKTRSIEKQAGQGKHGKRACQCCAARQALWLTAVATAVAAAAALALPPPPPPPPPPASSPP